MVIRVEIIEVFSSSLSVFYRKILELNHGKKNNNNIIIWIIPSSFRNKIK